MEQELKLALDCSNDLERLLAALPTPRTVIRQSNHYLVCVDRRTTAAGVMVRLRTEERGDERSACVTLKRRVRASDGVFLSWELEEPIDYGAALSIIEGQLSLMDVDHRAVRWLSEELHVNALRHQGRLLNLRHVIDFDGYVLEVDRSEFPDGSIDVEIEVETDDPQGAKQTVCRLTQREGIAVSEQHVGKYTRYLNRGGQS